ncbi:MAG: hypothetical protein ABL963_00905 [Longimicrobiales bacterium]
MNWDAVGALAELTGAIAVVISVLYLAWQVRGQVQETRLTAIHEVSVGFREGIAATFMDRQLAELFVKAKDGAEGLPEADRLQFVAFIQRNYRVWEDAFYQHRQGRLDDPHWHSMDRQYSSFLSWPGVRWVWSIRREFYTPQFREYVDSLKPAPHPF